MTALIKIHPHKLVHLSILPVIIESTGICDVIV